jgi:hypothetical protein
MAKKTFMPRTDLEKQQWLQNFAAKLTSYQTKYTLAAADITDMQNGSVYFNYWLNYRNQYEVYFRKLTEYKNEIRDGVAAGASPSVAPVVPAMAAAPTAVAPGIFARASSLGSIIKMKPNYTVADGNDLGIEGAEDSTNPQTMQPSISLRLVSGGHPEVVWQKHGMDGVEIWSDHGTGTFTMLAVDTVPNYTDTTALPAGTAQLWKYKAIYRLTDEQVGLWSDVVSITVGV